METPAMRVKSRVYATADQLLNKIAEEDILDAKGKVIVKESDYIDEQAAKAIEKMKGKSTEKFSVRPYLTGEVEYISPEYDEKYIIADISTPVDEHKNILIKRVPGRHFMTMEIYHINDITHVDINPSQIFSPNTSIIPFVDHDDAVRASMGTNMQRQAVPLVKPEAPFVGTGLEGDIAEMTYAVVKAEGE
jgi:DNA-directed RNA polymerase subunit beta